MNKIYRLICVVMLSSIECCPRAVHSDDGHGHRTEHKKEHEKKHVHDEARETGHKNHSDDGHDDEKPANGEKEEHAEHEEHKDEEDGKDKHAHEEEHEEGEHGEEEEVSSSVGPGKAVTEANPSKGFKLSEKALKTLEIQARSIDRRGQITIPETCLVEFKDETGIYRWRDGYFKLIEGTAQKTGRAIIFKPRSSSDLQPGDQVVTNGVPLLRVAELDAFSEGEAGHAH